MPTRRDKCHLTLLISLLFTCEHFRGLCKAQTYEDAFRLQKSKLNRNVYSPQIRPVLNQSDIVYVNASFNVVTIVDVDDVSQSFTCNGFVSLNWSDQILAWDPEEHANIGWLVPRVKDVWKPRLILVNTMGPRDPFADVFSPIFVYSNGRVEWYPGSLITASCDLDMTKFPFDQQECTLVFNSMNHGPERLRMVEMSPRGGEYFFQRSGEWDLKYTLVDSYNENETSGFRVTFKLARLPDFFMRSIMCPVMLLSILNFFVFALPADSGEKVDFAMTVLLSQSVFMTALTNMLPATSNSLPRVTVYVIFLLTKAAFSAIVSILVVYIHRTDWDSTTSSSTTTQASSLALTDSTIKGDVAEAVDRISATCKRSRRRMLASSINRWSFIVSLLAWIVITLWVFITIMT